MDNTPFRCIAAFSRTFAKGCDGVKLSRTGRAARLSTTIKFDNDSMRVCRYQAIPYQI